MNVLAQTVILLTQGDRVQHKSIILHYFSCNRRYCFLKVFHKMSILIITNVKSMSVSKLGKKNQKSLLTFFVLYPKHQYFLASICKANTLNL